MTIRPATVEDLPNCADCAKLFYASSSTFRAFDIERFCAMWTELLSKNTGVVFLALENEEVAGAIGGVVYPDPYSGELIGTEFFWWIRPSSRGCGMRLYKVFEQWARARKCVQLRMGHLSDLMPEKVKSVYLRLGFRHIESHYAKELS